MPLALQLVNHGGDSQRLLRDPLELHQLFYYYPDVVSIVL